MQTFYTDHSFTVTAQHLDYRRLGKQRVETKQILMTLLGESNGWRNHPAVRMWEGYETALCWYGMAMCWEWRQRKYVDNLQPYFQKTYMELVQFEKEKPERLSEGVIMSIDDELYKLREDSDDLGYDLGYDLGAWRQYGLGDLLPWWMDPENPISDAMIASHRSNLIRKKPEHYSELWPELDGSLEYLWPV